MSQANDRAGKIRFFPDQSDPEVFGVSRWEFLLHTENAPIHKSGLVSELEPSGFDAEKTNTLNTSFNDDDIFEDD